MNETIVRTNVWAAMMNSKYAPLDITLTAIVAVYVIYKLSANIDKGIDNGYSVGVKVGEFWFSLARSEDG